jgi:hypothetical protein
VNRELLQETIACGPPRSGIFGVTQLGCAPGEEDRHGTASEHRLVTGPRIVGSIARDLGYRLGNLLQQRGQQLAIVHPTPRELHRDDLFRPLIHPQVYFAPCAPTTHTMLPDAPLPAP